MGKPKRASASTEDTHAVPGNTTADELFKDFPDVAAMLKDFARAECPTILVIVRFVSAQSAASFPHRSSRALPPVCVCQDKVHVVHHHLYATRARLYYLVLLLLGYRGEVRSFAGTKTNEILTQGYAMWQSNRLRYTIPSPGFCKYYRHSLSYAVSRSSSLTSRLAPKAKMVKGPIGLVLRRSTSHRVFLQLKRSTSNNVGGKFGMISTLPYGVVKHRTSSFGLRLFLCSNNWFFHGKR